MCPAPPTGSRATLYLAPPKTVTLTRLSTCCPTLDWPHARIPTASPAPAGQPNTRLSPPANRDTVGIPILTTLYREMDMRFWLEQAETASIQAV